MPIDPSIALAVKSPTFNIADPNEQFGQILSLHNLMGQQQLHQAQMQNIASEMQDRQYKLANAQKFQSFFKPGQPEPTPADVYGALGADGTKVVQEMLANRKADLENSNAHLGRLSNYASTILNDPKGPNDFTFQYNIHQAIANKDITEAEGNEMLKHSVTDPETLTHLRAFQQNAMDAANQQKYLFTEADNQHKLVTAAAEAGQKTQDQKQAELATASQGIGSITDIKQLPDFLAKVGPEAQKFYGGYANSNLPLDQIKSIIALGGVKTEPGKTVPFPQSVVQQQVETAQAKTLAEKAAEMQAMQPVMQSVLRGDQRLQDLPADVQSKIAPGLIAGGYQGFGKLISDAERKRLADMDRALTILQGTQKTLTNPDIQDMMGNWGGMVTQFPRAIEHQKLQSDLLTQQQELKGFVTNGSLRGLNAETLNQMFPSIWSQPETANHQIDNLMTTIKAEREQYLQDLGDKVIPPGLKTPPAPGQTPAAAGPAAQPAGGSAGLPGKVHVRRPDGQTGYINKSALPLKGYVEIP